MATIATVSHGNYTNTSRRQYISVAAFQNDIFQYTTSLNPQTFVTTGTLTSLATVGTGTSTTCPANRILRENGKKLYPPSINAAGTATTTIVGPYPGVNTYMVGVYDVQSGLSGYIDPNSPVFSIYNSDKPNFVPRGLNPNGGAVDQGTPILTTGSITTSGVITAAELVVQNAATITQATTTAQTANCAANSYFKVVVSTGDAFTINATNVIDGQIVVMAINTTSAAVAPVITFGTNMRPTTTGTGTLTVTSGATATIIFIGLGTELVELSRVAAVTAA